MELRPGPADTVYAGGALIDRHVHNHALQALDAEDERAEAIGDYLLLRSPLTPEDADLTDDERTFLSDKVGAIILIEEDSVAVNYFDRGSELQQAWEQLKVSEQRTREIDEQISEDH